MSFNHSGNASLAFDVYTRNGLTQQITFESRSAVNSYGEPVYLTGIIANCLINYNSAQILGADGREITSNGSIQLLATPEVNTTDRVTLHTGEQPLILRVNKTFTSNNVLMTQEVFI